MTCTGCQRIRRVLGIKRRVGVDGVNPDKGLFADGLTIRQKVLHVGGALIVLYSNNLEATQAKIEQAGGNIVKPIFPFPGGRRFHFTEPSGNELAVWSEQE